MNLYSVSNEAYDGLVAQARGLGYVSPYPVERVHGLGEYISTIAFGEFEDARPDEYKELDRESLERGILPCWYDDNLRYKRRFRLRPAVEDRLYQVALAYGISNFRRTDSVRRKASVLGAILEAIGLGYLRPVNPPGKVRASRARRPPSLVQAAYEFNF